MEDRGGRMEETNKSGIGKKAARVGVAGAIALGAVASGLLLTRSGRRLLGEVWEGRRRTTIEDRVLDRLWHDKVVGRRRIDAAEIEPGVIELTGVVRSELERGRVLALVELVKGVREVDDRMEMQAVDPVKRRQRL